MTTFSDPPLSRRAARQGEAGDARPATPPPFAADSESASDQQQGSAAAPPSAATHVAPEPLTYVTQARRPLPDYDGPHFRARPAESEHDEAQHSAGGETPGYRVRDYRPESRPTPSWAPSYTGSTAAAQAADGASLDYQTQARAHVPVPSASAGDDAAAAGTPAESASVVPDPAMPPAPPVSAEPAAAASTATPAPSVTPGAPISPERTMTRRELRALREAQEAAAAAAGAPAPTANEWLQAPPPAAAPAPAEPVDAAPVEAAPVDAVPVVAVPVDAAPVQAELADAAPAQVEPAQSEPAQPEPVEAAPVEPPPALVEPQVGTWFETSPADSAPSRLPADSQADDAQPATSDAVEPDPASAEPVALVEPPEEPKRDAASVFDALFTPPTQRDADEAPTPASDPFAFLGAPPAPSASARVDLPAPPQAGMSAPQQAAPIDLPPPAGAPSAQLDSSYAPPPAAPAPASAPSGSPFEATAVEIDPVAEPQLEVVPEVLVQVEPVVESEPIVAEPAAPLAAPDPGEIVIELATPISEAPAPTTEARPVNHWSNQEDDEEPQGGTERSVLGGHGVVTTNALVLPNIPQPDFGAALTSTGEILVTGSIDLPRSLSSTGAHPTQLDQADLDSELDPGDQQVASVDSAPVRAIRAVSTHTSTRGMIVNAKPRGNRALTGLIAAAGGMALVVGGLLIYGLTTGVLGP